MFANALLMLPDFGTILLGALLARRFAFQRGFWDGAERLVYYVLFPALLFNSILNAQFSLATDSLLLGPAVVTLLSAAAMGFLARPRNVLRLRKADSFVEVLPDAHDR